MHVKRITIPVALVAVAVIFAGCASTTAPSDFLDGSSQMQMKAYGSWIRAEHYEGSEPTDLAAVTEGEFIALHDQKIIVLTDKSVVEIPVIKMLNATLTTYDSEHGMLALWTIAGIASTASHGMGSACSAPLWLLTGIFTTAGQSRTPIEKYPRQSWDELRKFARFPQGLPPGLDLNKLEPKN